MNTARKVAHNTLIQIAGKFFSTLLGLIAIAIITRYLGQAGFGEYTTIFTYLSFFAVLADFGLTLVTAQMISKAGVDKNKIINNLFTLRLFTAIVLLGIAVVAVLFFPYSFVIKLGIVIASISFLFIALSQILVGLFQKELKMGKVSIAENIGRIFLIIGVIIAIKYDYGLIGIVVATVISSGINFLFHYLFSFTFVKIRLKFDLEVWKEIFLKSWPLAITIFFNLIYLRADILILSIIKTDAEVGIYGVAYRIIDVLITVPFMFAGIILPIITASWAEKNISYFKKVFQKSFDFMVILAMPLVPGTWFLSDSIMVITAGDEFLVSGKVLKILILASAIIFLGTMFSHALIAIDRQKKIIGAYVFTGITALFGYFIFIPKFSYIGAAWVTVYSELAIALFSIYYFHKYTNFLPNMNLVLKSLLASIGMGFCIYLVPNYLYEFNIMLVLFIIIFMVIYFLFLYLLKGVEKKDIKIFFNKF